MMANATAEKTKTKLLVMAILALNIIEYRFKILKRVCVGGSVISWPIIKEERRLCSRPGLRDTTSQNVTGPCLGTVT